MPIDINDKKSWNRPLEFDLKHELSGIYHELIH